MKQAPSSFLLNVSSPLSPTKDIQFYRLLFWCKHYDATLVFSYKNIAIRPRLNILIILPSFINILR